VNRRTTLPASEDRVHLWVDARGGVSGNALLAALLDAGASLEAVDHAVETLGVGDVRVTMGRVQRNGQQAVTVRVRAPQETPMARRWAEIRAVLDDAPLEPSVSTRASNALRTLVEAEAEVLEVLVGDLELPEVGVLDTLAVVVAVCAAVDDLGVDDVTCSPIALGAGSAPTPTGRRLLPEPVTEALLRNHAVRHGAIGRQLTTRTGACLLATLGRTAGEPPALQDPRVGTGTAGRDTVGPMLLRVHLGHT
jgi:pyridinium-3,5-bisthiocarboxylic acid mononucleotide nickel chelatase